MPATSSNFTPVSGWILSVSKVPTWITSGLQLQEPRCSDFKNPKTPTSRTPGLQLKEPQGSDITSPRAPPEGTPRVPTRRTSRLRLRLKEILGSLVISSRKAAGPRHSAEPREDPKSRTPQFWALLLLWRRLWNPKVDLLFGYLRPNFIWIP